MENIKYFYPHIGQRVLVIPQTSEMDEFYTVITKICRTYSGSNDYHFEHDFRYFQYDDHRRPCDYEKDYLIKFQNLFGGHIRKAVKNSTTYYCKIKFIIDEKDA